MRLGMNVLQPMLGRETFRFARQAGAQAIVARLVDFDRLERRNARFDPRHAAGPRPLPTLDELRALRADVEAEGLALAGIENLDPAWWSDVLLDGPRRGEQLAALRTFVRDLGTAGIPVLGYNVSLAGIWGQAWGVPAARGGALTGSFDGDALLEPPVPPGELWNMVVPGARVPVGVDRDVLWARLRGLVAELAEAGEGAGVVLALHPDDPPVAELRGTPRLLHRPEDLQRMLDEVPSPANGMLFCQGTVTEMVGEAAVYDEIARFAAQGRIGYVHLRNVKGRVPRYDEAFVDDGDVDVRRALRLYANAGFTGVLVPDHVPSMTCDAPWHAGMAFTLGYLRALLDGL